ncbi:hypothetical protein NKH70_12590, partial [Mesorhizobium sp. M0991]
CCPSTSPKQQQPDQTRYRSRFEGHPSKAPASTCSENSAYLDAGNIVEQGPAAVLFSNPERQRTKRFIATLKHEAEREGGGEG